MQFIWVTVLYAETYVCDIVALQDSLHYEIIGSERALSFYYLNPDTGVITLKRLFTEGTHTKDEVNIRDIKSHSHGDLHFSRDHLVLQKRTRFQIFYILGISKIVLNRQVTVA